MAREGDSLEFSIIHDYGSFGDGKWSKHLTLIKWGDNDPKFDIRTWNEDMTKCGKGVTFTLEDLLDLQPLLDEAVESYGD